METLVEVEGNAEAKFEDKAVAKTSSAPNSLKLITDPVVYQLVRVEGDGRLVPATDDEVMEVEDLLEDGKSEMCFLTDIGGTVECILIDKCSSEKTDLKSSEGLFQSENLEFDSEKSNAVLDSGVNLAETEESVPSATTSTNGSSICQSGGGQCSSPQGGETESGLLTSIVCSSWKPDFFKLEGEICLNNLSVRELHETFRATFGRETSVKDKQWLKRRIAMGLTNSCDFSTTTFVIEDNVVKKEKEGRSKIADSKHAKDPAIGAMDEKCGAKILAWNEDQSKGFGSPQGDSLKKFQKENPGKVTEKQLVSGLFKMLGQMGGHLSPGRILLEVLGIQIPYVSRVRRGRPRENFMTLVKLQPKGMGMAAKLVKKAFSVCDSQPATGRGNKVVKTGPAPGWVQQPLITKRENTEEYLERKTTDLDKHDVSFQHMDSSSDTSDDNIVTVPTANGGMRRKHHRPWTLSEVVKLVEGEARYGAGRWSEIKRVSFASYSYRTSVDLKDKWRNLLRASFAQLPADKVMDNSRKPATIIVRVRELAEMQSQVPPNLSVGKFAGHGSSVHETRSGYL